MTLTDTTLAEIEAAARAATEGEWSAQRNNHFWEIWIGEDQVGDLCASDIPSHPLPAGSGQANARFITLACNNAAAMVGEIRALREALRKTTMDAMRFKGICVQADLWANTPSPAYWAKIESRPVPDHGSGPISTKD